MRTLFIIVGGFLLWAACLGVAKVAGGSRASAMTTATVVFVAIWFVAAAANLWLGVSRAGYSFREELPIFLLLFLLLAAGRGGGLRQVEVPLKRKRGKRCGGIGSRRSATA
jgi:hypothetical protein